MSVFWSYMTSPVQGVDPTEEGPTLFTGSLRGRAESCRQGRPKPKSTAKLLDEAAAEIERLRAEMLELQIEIWRGR